jgi:nuclear mRNA export protein SAC3
MLLSSSLASEWAAWVSMNPENDRTAIWLECKFDIPASGEWLDDSIFSIPLSDNGNSSTRFPGIVVFECTPFKGVTDEIEKLVFTLHLHVV